MGAEAHPELVSVLEAVPELAGATRRVTPIAEGRTNRNFRVDVDDASYFVRLSDPDTSLLGIDRSAEHLAAAAAAAAGIAPEVVAFLPELGCLVTRWLDGDSLEEGDLEREPTLGRAVGIVRTVHAGPDLPWAFSAFRVVETYRTIAEERTVAVPEAYGPTHEVARRIEAAFAEAPTPDRPCHNDLLAPNFIRDGDRLWLVDHEYAGMGDPFFDLGNLSINNALSEDAQERMLHHYFGDMTEAHRARLGLMRMMSDFREAMWGVAQQGLSTLEIDFVAYADHHFERLGRSLADPRMERWLVEAARGIPA